MSGYITSDDERLSRCPFCGYPGAMRYLTIPTQICEVECTNCGAEGPPRVGHDAAAYAWNHRIDQRQDEK